MSFLPVATISSYSSVSTDIFLKYQFDHFPVLKPLMTLLCLQEKVNSLGRLQGLSHANLLFQTLPNIQGTASENSGPHEYVFKIGDWHQT